MNNRSNKPWEEHEKYQLWLAFQIHTSFKVMEEYFGRSATGINKFLSRSGIRLACKNASSLNNSRKIKTSEDLHQIIISCALDIETVGLEYRHTRKWRPSHFTRTALKTYGICGPAPWIGREKNKILPIHSEVGNISKKTPWVYVSTEAIINYLSRHNFYIETIPYKNPCGWTHLINNRQVNICGILREANIIRRNENEPIFHVKGVTYE